MMDETMHLSSMERKRQERSIAEEWVWLIKSYYVSLQICLSWEQHHRRTRDQMQQQWAKKRRIKSVTKKVRSTFTHSSSSEVSAMCSTHQVDKEDINLKDWDWLYLRCLNSNEIIKERKQREWLIKLINYSLCLSIEWLLSIILIKWDNW